MLIKLKSNVVINTRYITAIEPYDEEYEYANDKDNEIKYILYMTDGRQWHMTEEDYYIIDQKV